MHAFINMLALTWLVTWKSTVNLFHSFELGLYLALGAVDRQTVGGEVLTALDNGGGWAEVYILLWWDLDWARRLLRQHEKRRQLRDAQQ
jgi:hypothetical protein